MTDIVLSPIGHGFNRNKIDSNFDKVEEVVNNDVLHRKGGNNIMEQDLLLDGNRIVGLPEAIGVDEAVGLGQLQELLSAVEGAAGVVPIITPRQIGDGNTTTFSSSAGAGAYIDAFTIYVSGVYQKPRIDFSVDSGSGAVTFLQDGVADAPAVGASIDITYFTPQVIEIENPNEDTLITASGTVTPRTLADWAEKEVLSYNSVADAKADVSLEVGRRVKTYGYYTSGDGGGGEYVVSTWVGPDDGGSLHQLDNGLQLDLVSNELVYLRQFGAKGDGATDDSTAIDNAIKFAANKTLLLQDGRYGVSKQVIIDNNVKIVGTLAAHDDASTVRTASWFEILPSSSFAADEGILKVVNTTGVTSIRRWVEIQNTGFYGNRTTNTNGNAIICTARNVKVIDCSILQFPDNGIWSKDQANAGSNSSIFENNWVGFNGGTGLRMDRTSFSGDNFVRGGHYHWNDESGVYVNQPNTSLVGVYSWWNLDGFTIGETLSGLTDLVGCRGYDNARAGCYLVGAVDNINISGDFHSNGNDTRWATLPSTPTFTDEERAGIYADGACKAIIFGPVQFGYLASAGKQRRGFSLADVNAEITITGYGADGDSTLAVKAATLENIKYHGTESQISHPGFVASGDIDLNQNSITSVDNQTFHFWDTAVITANSVPSTSTTMVLNETGAATINDITSPLSGLPMVIFRNGNTGAVTFTHNNTKLRNIGLSNITLNQYESIGYLRVSGAVWQQIMGKF